MNEDLSLYYMRGYYWITDVCMTVRYKCRCFNDAKKPIRYCVTSFLVTVLEKKTMLLSEYYKYQCRHTS